VQDQSERVLTDEEFAVVKERYVGLIRIWKDRLWLNSWAITPDFERSGWAGAFGDGEFSRAECTQKWEYLDATIRVNCPAVVDLAPAALEEHVVHELLHVALAEMDAAAPPACHVCKNTIARDIRHEERTVVVLARAFIDAYKNSPAPTAAAEAA
jgi:hypothetical protein